MEKTLRGELEEKSKAVEEHLRSIEELRAQLENSVKERQDQGTQTEQDSRILELGEEV